MNTQVAIVQVDENSNDFTNLKSTRKFLDNPNFNQGNILQGIDSVAAISINGNHYWYNDATHGVGTTYNGSLLYPLFKYYMEHVESNYGKSGSDRVWMAPLQEVHEYLVVRDETQLVSTLNGNELQIQLILTDVPEDLRRHALSLAIHSDVDFSSISTNEEMDYSFKGAGSNKLINLDWSIPSQTWVSHDKQSPERNNIKLDLSQPEERIKLFPNPVDDIIYLQVESEVDTEYLISITDIIGQLVFSVNIYTPEGSSIVQLNLVEYNISPGVYFLIANGEGLDKQVAKFVKD